MASYSTDTKGATDNGMPPFTDILKQINFSGADTIATNETGRKIAQKLYSDQTSSETNLNYFRARAVKWVNILKWATGIYEANEFLDFFNISDANKAYVKIDMSRIMLGPMFVGTLVESMSKNEEYPCVTAVDDGSMEQKEKRKLDALFRMHEAEKINALQQAAGYHLEPPNAYVPDDEVSAKVYFELEDRLPKEIKFEQLLANILSENKYQRIFKRKTIYDLIVHNFGITKIERTVGKKYCVRKPVPQNVFYNYFTGDSGELELGYIGELYNLKVRDLRTRYGQSPDNPKGLTEREIYDFAKISTTRNSGWFNFGWREEYSIYNYNRPWDDYSIYVMDFEINISLSDYYVGKPDSFGNENIAPKKGIPEPKSDKATLYKKNKTRWYRGVYVPYSDKMIYWGLPDLVILPHLDTERSLSSWTVNIPFNNGQYVPSLFERGMEPLKEYALTKLKRKQLIAKLRPSGIRIDVESARNIDLGNGNSIDWEEIVRIFDQTGNELWSSRGVNPMEKEMPALSNTPNDDAVQKIIQLTNMLTSILAELRQVWGVPSYRDGSDVGDRTPAKLAEGQNQSSFNVTDFIMNANNELWEETLYKCCLLEWQNVVTQEPEDKDDLINTRFRVNVEMKTTDYERQQLESDIAIGLKEGSLTHKDAFVLRNIKNFKLAQWYLSSTEEKNKREAAKAQQDAVQQNQQVQQASLQQKAQSDAAMKQAELSAEIQRDKAKLDGEKELAVLNGIFAIYAKGPLPDELKPLAVQAISNVAMPLTAENAELRGGLNAMMQQGQQPQQPPQGSPQGQQQGPPPPDQSQQAPPEQQPGQPQ